MSAFDKIQTKIIEILEIMNDNSMKNISHHQELGGVTHKPNKEYLICIDELKVKK